MDLESLRSQLLDGKEKRDYTYNCCGKTYHGIYEIRKHLFEVHPDWHRALRSCFKRSYPRPLTGEEVQMKLREKEWSHVREREQEERQPHNAWIIYHHNGQKNR